MLRDTQSTGKASDIQQGRAGTGTGCSTCVFWPGVETRQMELENGEAEK